MIRQARSPRSAPLACALLLASLAALAGCASPQAKADAYDKALAPYQGMSEEALVARWGKPVSEEQTGSGRWLTFVNNNPAGPGSSPTVGFSIGGFGFGGGGHSGVGVGVGATAPISSASPISTCTTRFLVENNKVSSWTFEGAGCNAAS